MTLDDVATLVGRSMKTAITPIAARTDTLEQRLAALEAKPHVKFVGVWAADRAYVPGDAVVHGNALWHCKAATSGAVPGTAPGWQLVIKSPPRK